jgi:hypothetical protein
MRKLVTLATALSLFALTVPMQASAETASQPVTKTEAAKTPMVVKQKVSTFKKTKHYAKSHHRQHFGKYHRLHNKVAYKAHHKHMAVYKKHHKHPMHVVRTA